MAKTSSVYSEPCKYLKTNISDIKKKIPNFIIDLYKIRKSKILLDKEDINFHIKNIFISISAIRSVLEKTNTSD
jgi:hypothetical protein